MLQQDALKISATGNMFRALLLASSNARATFSQPGMPRPQIHGAHNFPIKNEEPAPPPPKKRKIIGNRTQALETIPSPTPVCSVAPQRKMSLQDLLS